MSGSALAPLRPRSRTIAGGEDTATATSYGSGAHGNDATVTEGGSATATPVAEENLSKAANGCATSDTEFQTTVLQQLQQLQSRMDELQRWQQGNAVGSAQLGGAGAEKGRRIWIPGPDALEEPR